MGGEPAVADHRTDPESAAGQVLDLRQRQGCDVDHGVRRLDALPHQVDQVRPTAEIRRVRPGGERVDRGPYVQRPQVGERLHPATSAMESTIPLYAPHRHRLPLMRSLISLPDGDPLATAGVSVTALGSPRRYSPSIATAEQIWPGVQ